MDQGDSFSQFDDPAERETDHQHNDLVPTIIDEEPDLERGVSPIIIANTEAESSSGGSSAHRTDRSDHSSAPDREAHRHDHEQTQEQRNTNDY